MTRAKCPPSTCGTPSCDEQIPRGRLMCRPHWFALPRPLREAINSAWRERRIRDWSVNCLEARRFLAGHPDPQERNAALRDRIIGERTEA